MVLISDRAKDEFHHQVYKKKINFTRGVSKQAPDKILAICRARHEKIKNATKKLLEGERLAFLKIRHLFQSDK